MSWSISEQKLIPIIGEPRFEIVLKNGGIGYKIMNQQASSNRAMLCQECKAKVSKKIDSYRIEIKKKLDTLPLTPNRNVPGYRIIRNLGVVEYSPVPSNMFDQSKKFESALIFLKSEALKRGGNALINFKKTLIKKPNQSAPPRPKQTWQDFIPGYGKPKYLLPGYMELPLFKAEVVVVQKLETKSV